MFKVAYIISKMGNVRKKYTNIKKLPSEDIDALLDSVESNDKEEIENLMNYSETEFVTEDNTVISINDLYEWGERLSKQLQLSSRSLDSRFIYVNPRPG